MNNGHNIAQHDDAKYVASLMKEVDEEAKS